MAVVPSSGVRVTVAALRDRGKAVSGATFGE